MPRPSRRGRRERFDGDVGDSTRRVAALAAEYDQSVILGFSRIGEAVDEIVALLDLLEEREFQIVSLSAFFAT